MLAAGLCLISKPGPLTLPEPAARASCLRRLSASPGAVLLTHCPLRRTPLAFLLLCLFAMLSTTLTSGRAGCSRILLSLRYPYPSSPRAKTVGRETDTVEIITTVDYEPLKSEPQFKCLFLCNTSPSALRGPMLLVGPEGSGLLHARQVTTGTLTPSAQQNSMT